MSKKPIKQDAARACLIDFLKDGPTPRAKLTMPRGWLTLRSIYIRLISETHDWTFVEGVRRGNFRLHPNGRWGVSDGCITLVSQHQFDRLRDYLLSQPTKPIPGTSTPYYGTVDVR